MITWHDGPSVIIDWYDNEWKIYTASIDCFAIANEFPDLHITPDEASEVVEGLLMSIEETMYDYMEDWLKDVRG